MLFKCCWKMLTRQGWVDDICVNELGPISINLGPDWLVLIMACRLFCADRLQWRHNGRDSVSNHQPHECLLNRLFKRRSKKTSQLRVTGLCVGNSPGTGEFPAQMASNAENDSIWWRHHDIVNTLKFEQNNRYFANEKKCISIKQYVDVLSKLHWNLFPGL